MTDLAPRRAEVAQTARIIRDDILRRQLSAGEQYLTAADVANLFGVQEHTAGRAMRILAKDDWLVRRRGVGTFVGPAAGSDPSAAPATLHVITSRARLHSGLNSDELMLGLVEGFGAAGVQFDLLPPQGERAFVKSLLQRGAEGGSISGLVLMACPRDVQELAAESGIPVVVFGGVHTTTRQLCSVDLDSLEMGRLLAGHLVKGNHKRIVVMLRDRWLPGDNLLLDGMHEALDGARLAIRSLPTDVNAVRAEVQRLLQGDDRPTGWVCHGRLFTQITVQTILEAGLVVGRDVDVISDVPSAELNLPIQVPHIEPADDFRAQARRVGMMLQQLAHGARPQPDHLTIPVSLVGTTGSKRVSSPRDNSETPEGTEH